MTLCWVLWMKKRQGNEKWEIFLIKFAQAKKKDFPALVLVQPCDANYARTGRHGGARSMTCPPDGWVMNFQRRRSVHAAPETKKDLFMTIKQPFSLFNNSRTLIGSTIIQFQQQQGALIPDLPLLSKMPSRSRDALLSKQDKREFGEKRRERAVRSSERLSAAMTWFYRKMTRENDTFQLTDTKTPQTIKLWLRLKFGETHKMCNRRLTYWIGQRFVRGPRIFRPAILYNSNEYGIVASPNLLGALRWLPRLATWTYSC